MTVARFWTFALNEMVIRPKGGKHKNRGWHGRGGGGGPGGGGGGGGGAARSSYQYYKIEITAVDGGAYVSSQAIDLLRSSASVIAESAEAGGEAADSSSAGYSATEAVNMMTGDSGIGWLEASPGNQAGWLRYSPGIGAQNFTKCIIAPIGGLIADAPKDFVIEYSADDIAYFPAATITGESGWLRGERRIYDLSGASAAHWRVRITDNVSGLNEVGIMALAFMTADGHHWSEAKYNVLTNSLTEIASNNAAWMTTNQESTDGWTSIMQTTETVIISFGQQVEVDEMQWTSRVAEGARSPKDFTIEGSNDLVSWDVLKTLTSVTGWGSLETKSFTW